MTRRSFVLGTLTVLLLCAPRLLAHDEFRIIGTVTKINRAQIQVKNKEGKTFSIARNKNTITWRDKKKVEATELKVGQSVVVNAVGDSYADLVALAVTIVPPIAATR